MSKETQKYVEIQEFTNLPEDWITTELEKVAELKQGKTPKREQYDDRQGFRIIKVKDFEDGKKVEINPKGDRSFVKVYLGEENTVKTNDILILNSGHSSNVVGQKVGFVPKELEGAFYVAELTRIRGIDKVANNYFLFVLLQTKFIRKLIKELVKGGHLYIRHLKSLPVPLPPLPEQKAIAFTLRSVQEAKEATEKVISSLKELKKSLMKHLFTYGPVPINQKSQVKLKDTEVGQIPEHWEVAKLGELFSVQQGKQLSKKKKAKDNEIKCKFLRTSNVLWEGIKLQNLDIMKITEKELEKLKVKKGDIFVCEGGEVGRTAILEIDIDFDLVYQNHLHRLRPKANDINSKFFVYWMEKYIRLDKVHVPANTTTIPNLSASRLKEFPVPLPPVEEQEKIAQILRAVDEKIEAEEKRKEALESLFKSLLNNLMTAKIRLPEEFIKKFEEESNELCK